MARVWISYGELADIIGIDMAQTLCATRGGVSVYVPKEFSARAPLLQIINTRALCALISVYGGETVVVPNHRRGAPRKAAIIKMLTEGASAREIALRLDVTQRYVEHVASVCRPQPRQISILDLLTPKTA